MYNYKELDPDQCEFVEVCAEEELSPGERLFLTVGDHDIVLLNIDEEYYAIADVCSHDDGPLGDGDVEGMEIICPRHGARFDIRSGKVLSLPAIVDIAAYPLRIVDGIINIGIPEGE